MVKTCDIFTEDCDNVIFIATSVHKVMPTKKSDINDYKIKTSKKFSQSEKLRWTIFNWYFTNATCNKHLLAGTIVISLSVSYDYVGTSHVIFYCNTCKSAITLFLIGY